MTRDEVILALKQCLRGSDGSICEKCPLTKEDFYKCRLMLRDDAIKLPKDRDSVEPYMDYDGRDVWLCGNCNVTLFHPTHIEEDYDMMNYIRYCKHCGKKVEWK